MSITTEAASILYKRTAPAANTSLSTLCFTMSSYHTVSTHKRSTMALVWEILVRLAFFKYFYVPGTLFQPVFRKNNIFQFLIPVVWKEEKLKELFIACRDSGVFSLHLWILYSKHRLTWHTIHLQTPFLLQFKRSQHHVHFNRNFVLKKRYQKEIWSTPSKAWQHQDHKSTHLGAFFPSDAVLKASFVTATRDALGRNEAAEAGLWTMSCWVPTTFLIFVALGLSLEPCPQELTPKFLHLSWFASKNRDKEITLQKKGPKSLIHLLKQPIHP